MSSKAITERKDGTSGRTQWSTPVEEAPSTMQDMSAQVFRWIGAFGLAFLVLGGVTLLVQATGRTTFIASWLASLIAILGVGALMFHAASEADLQIRRAYMGLGYLCLALGAILAIVPYPTVGSQFLPNAAVCFVMGLLFLLAFVRNETEAKFRNYAINVLGAAGAVLSFVGFLWGTIYGTSFMLPYGVILILLGLAFVWAFIGLRGVADNGGYYAAFGAGLVGLTVFLIALGRSAVPALLEKLKWAMPSGSYAMPSGLLLMTGGLLFLGIGIGYCSDRQIVVLTRRELGALFYSPMAYLVLLGYVFLGFCIFGQFVLTVLWEYDPVREMGQPSPLPEPIVRGYILNWFPVICMMLLVPVLTMRIFSEERRSGTFEMMFTAPVEELTVVLSKFLAVLIFFMVVWLPWGLYLVSLRVEGGTEFDYTPLLGFAVMLLFNGAAFLSMGLFFSSTTRNQLGAAVMTFGVLFLLMLDYFIKPVTSPTGTLRAVMTQVSFVDTWRTTLAGKVIPRDLVFFLSSTIFWLFATVKVLESRKWR